MREVPEEGGRKGESGKARGAEGRLREEGEAVVGGAHRAGALIEDRILRVVIEETGHGKTLLLPSAQHVLRGSVATSGVALPTHARNRCTRRAIGAIGGPRGGQKGAGRAQPCKRR